jgi:hypothetical protein
MATNSQGGAEGPRSIVPIVLVAMVLLVGLYLILTPGDEGQRGADREQNPTSTAAARDSASEAASDAASGTSGTSSTAGTSRNGHQTRDDDDLPPHMAAVLNAPPPSYDDMPPEIAAEFQNPYAKISPAQREALIRASDAEFPPDILRDFQEAGDPDIPPHILRQFENPYPPGYDPDHPEDYVRQTPPEHPYPPGRDPAHPEEYVPPAPR